MNLAVISTCKRCGKVARVAINDELNHKDKIIIFEEAAEHDLVISFITKDEYENGSYKLGCLTNCKK